MGHRRKAREYALQGLYMYDITKTGLDDILELAWTEKEVPDDIRDFSRELIKGAIDNLTEIDNLIEKHSKNWKIERIDNVEKSILRISIYAMLHLKDVPVVVTINEAIELGKIFGGKIQASS